MPQMLSMIGRYAFQVYINLKGTHTHTLFVDRGVTVNGI